MRYLILVLMTVFILGRSTAYSWHDTGHMVIAQIAKNTLTNEAEQKLECLINSFQKSYPESSTIITSACWMDDITHHRLTAFGQWHYITFPYDPNKILSACEMDNLKAAQKSNNIVWAINECVQTLKSSKSNMFEKGLMVRFLMHLVGDIHQPCHTTSRFSKEHPQGDLGGNLFKLNAGDYVNLHQYWDSGLGLFPTKSRPLSYYDKTTIENLANNICHDFPKEQYKDKINTKPHQWAEESHQIAINYVYQISENSEPNRNYIKQGREICREQSALAGYRLAELLNAILK